MPTQTSADVGPGPIDPIARATQLADHYNDVGRFDDAEREAVRGLAASPDDVVLLIQLTRSLMGRARWQDAEAAIERVLAVDPENASGFNLLSVARSQQGRFGDAEAAVLEALRLDPQWASAYEVYGDLMMRTTHLEKARKLYERARALNPEDPDLPSKIALVETQLNRLTSASREAATGLRLGPAESLAHASRGVAHLASGHPFRARADFREALRLDPANAELEEVWLNADTCCRVVFLPMYYWSLVVDRLPGKQFLVWGFLLAFVFGGRALGLPPDVITVGSLTYLAFCVYSWLATPIVNVWKRIVPPKL